MCDTKRFAEYAWRKYQIEVPPEQLQAALDKFYEDHPELRDYRIHLEQKETTCITTNRN